MCLKQSDFVPKGYGKLLIFRQLLSAGCYPLTEKPQPRPDPVQNQLDMGVVGGGQDQRFVSCQKLLVGPLSGFEGLGASRGAIPPAHFVELSRDPGGIAHERFDSFLHGGVRFLLLPSAGAQSPELVAVAQLLALLHPAPEFVVVGQGSDHRSFQFQQVVLSLERQCPHRRAVVRAGTTLNLQQFLHQGNGKHQSQPLRLLDVDPVWPEPACSSCDMPHTAEAES